MNDEVDRMRLLVILKGTAAGVSIIFELEIIKKLYLYLVSL